MIFLTLSENNYSYGCTATWKLPHMQMKAALFEAEGLVVTANSEICVIHATGIIDFPHMREPFDSYVWLISSFIVTPII